MHATSLYIQQRKSPEFWNTKWFKEGTWLYSFGQNDIHSHVCTYFNKPNCLVRLGEVRFNKSAQSSLSTHLNKLKCSKHSTSGSDSPEHIDKKITHAWIQKEQPLVIRVSTIPQWLTMPPLPLKSCLQPRLCTLTSVYLAAGITSLTH